MAGGTYPACRLQIFPKRSLILPCVNFFDPDRSVVLIKSVVFDKFVKNGIHRVFGIYNFKNQHF
jgi:hypothetical protein